MRKLGILICITALSACEMIVVNALNMIETTEFTVDGSDLIMNGEINSKTLDQFNEVIEDNPQISTLVEVDVPGSLDDDTMYQLVYRVRELGLNTHLRSDSRIYSGGVDLFLGGVERSIETGAELGVHSWSDGVNEAIDFPRGSPEHEANRKLIEDMLGSDAFYWFTIEAAPADAIHVMTSDEIARFGLITP